MNAKNNIDQVLEEFSAGVDFIEKFVPIAVKDRAVGGDPEIARLLEIKRPGLIGDAQDLLEGKDAPGVRARGLTRILDDRLRIEGRDQEDRQDHSSG